MCRIQWFLAFLRSFFHSSLLCTFSCHPSLPTILPSFLTSPSISWSTSQSCCSQIHINFPHTVCKLWTEVLCLIKTQQQQICHDVRTYVYHHINAILILHMNFINNASGMKVAWLKVNLKMWFKLHQTQHATVLYCLSCYGTVTRQ